MEDNKPQRSFIAGDSWLYYKLYTGEKTSDSILTNIIKPITQELLQDGYIDSWFFIRYKDPKFHLRIRFHIVKEAKNINIIINKLLEPLNDYLAKDLLSNVVLDTYQRELERYGTLTIYQTEQLFYFDSTMVVDFLYMLNKYEEIDIYSNDEIRWLFGLKAIDNILDIFCYSENEKMEIMQSLKTSFGNEFGMSRPLKKQLDAKYRNNRDKIEWFMSNKEPIIGKFFSISKLLEMKNARSKNFASYILQLHTEGSLDVDLKYLTSSYIHMLMNRLFRSKNRLHEMVLYDFLYRFYSSNIARKKYSKLNDLKI